MVLILVLSPLLGILNTFYIILFNNVYVQYISLQLPTFQNFTNQIEMLGKKVQGFIDDLSSAQEVQLINTVKTVVPQAHVEECNVTFISYNQQMYSLFAFSTYCILNITPQ